MFLYKGIWEKSKSPPTLKKRKEIGKIRKKAFFFT